MNACNPGIQISLNSSIIYNAGTDLTFTVNSTDSSCSQIPHTISITNWLEDLFGNILTTSDLNQNFVCSNETNATITLPPNAAKGETVFVKTNITDTSCNDIDYSNNIASSPSIIVRGIAQENSSINITNVDVGPDNETKYGESATINLIIYRGNTSENVVNIVAINLDNEELSERTNITLGTKYTSYNLSVPLQMKPNCGGNFENGTHTVIAAGLGVNDIRNITVNGTSTCTTIPVIQETSSECPVCGGSGSSGGTSSASTVSTVAQTLYTITDYKSSVTVGEEFTTSVKIINNFTTTKNFTVYSYIYKGTEPVSLGYSNADKKWLGTFNANQQSISTGPKTSTTLTLKNIIENSTQAGDYNLRVRVKVDNKETDITKTISVKEAVQAAAVQNLTSNQTEKKMVNETANQTVNRTEENVTEESALTAETTTRITSQAVFNAYNVSGFFSPVTAIIKFILSLF